MGAVCRPILVALCALLLGGCTALREYLLDRRLGPGDAAAQQALDPPLQQELNRLYAQGAQALAGNDLDAAIAAWHRYVAAAPLQLPQARRLRGYLTLLGREAAKRDAAQAVASERAGKHAPTDRLHLAVFPLRSRGPNAAKDAFNRAVLAMISVDLSRVPSLTLLERERIDAVLRELDLGASGLVDRSALDVPARLLGAGTIVAGSVYNEPGPAGPGSGRYTIDTAVSEVGDGRVLGVQDADGRQDEFPRLEKRIVHGILDALGVKDIPPAVDRIHTRSWAAYARFAAGLSLLAEDRFDEARAAFRAALEFDPGFALAEEAFLDTPPKAAGIDEIKAELAPRR